MTTIAFAVRTAVYGQPRPRAAIRGKRAGVYADKSHAVNGMKRAVVAAWHDAIESRIKIGVQGMELLLNKGTPVHFKLVISLHSKRVQKPDADNVLKAVLDALTTAGAWRDDSQVVCSEAIKIGELKNEGLYVEIHYGQACIKCEMAADVANGAWDDVT